MKNRRIGYASKLQATVNVFFGSNPAVKVYLRHVRFTP